MSETTDYTDKRECLVLIGAIGRQIRDNPQMTEAQIDVALAAITSALRRKTGA